MEARNLQYLARHRGFASTHWTEIRACAGRNTVACEARENLCREYWYPLYLYIRRQGNDAHVAEDLTQGFFAYILDRPWFEKADQSRGRFRTFLLISLNNFLRDQFDRDNASKRGGDFEFVPHDITPSAHHPHGGDPITAPTEIYEFEWASAVVAAARRLLEEEYAVAGKQVQFNALKRYLVAEAQVNQYEETATALDTSLANVKVAVHRLRKRYGALLRERVALTVAAPVDIDDEMLHLRAVLATN